MNQALICVSFGTTVPAARQEIEAVERALEERSAVPEYRLPPIGGDLSGEDLAAYLTDPRFRAETLRRFTSGTHSAFWGR